MFLKLTQSFYFLYHLVLPLVPPTSSNIERMLFRISGFNQGFLVPALVRNVIPSSFPYKIKQPEDVIAPHLWFVCFGFSSESTLIVHMKVSQSHICCFCKFHDPIFIAISQPRTKRVLLLCLTGTSETSFLMKNYPRSSEIPFIFLSVSPVWTSQQCAPFKSFCFICSYQYVKIIRHILTCARFLFIISETYVRDYDQLPIFSWSG